MLKDVVHNIRARNTYNRKQFKKLDQLQQQARLLNAFRDFRAARMPQEQLAEQQQQQQVPNDMKTTSKTEVVDDLGLTDMINNGGLRCPRNINEARKLIKVPETMEGKHRLFDTGLVLTTYGFYVQAIAYEAMCRQTVAEGGSVHDVDRWLIQDRGLYKPDIDRLKDIADGRINPNWLVNR